MPKVSCIIPAYNEAERISAVLQVVSGHPLIQEIIVVDDCSKDETLNKVRTFRNIMVIAHEVNQGKSMAMYTGVTRSTGDFLLFLDSDLVGLTKENLTDLITPVLESRADVAISLRQNSPWWSKKFGLDYISGERVFHRDFLKEDLEQIPHITGYGLEVFMNKIILRKKSRLQVIYWRNVRFTDKSEKIGLIRGMIGELLMYFDIIKTVSPIDNIRMYMGMLSQKVK